MAKDLFKTISVKFITSLFVFLLFVTLNVNAQSTKEFINDRDTLIVYANVPGLSASPKYKMRVRSAATNSQWVECFTHYTFNKAFTLPNIPRTDGKPLSSTSVQHYQLYTGGWSHSYANIEMSDNSPVEVEISRNESTFKIGGKDFEVAKAHPAHKAFNTRVEGGVVYFTIYNPGQITIDINGQLDNFNKAIDQNDADQANLAKTFIAHAVTFFANPVMKKPSLNDPNIIYVEPGVKPSINLGAKSTLYFKPGVHDLGIDFQVYATKKYYIPGDAIVFGTFNNYKAPAVSGKLSGEDIKIYGYGTISSARITHPLYVSPPPSHDPYKSILIERAKNLEVNGVCIVDPAQHSANFWAYDSKTPTTAAHWIKIISWRANGDGLGYCHLITNSFFRTADDASYVTGHRRKNVYWKDTNAAVFHMSDMPDMGDDFQVIIEDCDVIYNRTRGLSSGGVFTMRAFGENTVKNANVIFRNIRITDPRSNMPVFNMFTEVGTNKGQSYKGLTFQNISIVNPVGSIKQQIMTGSSTAPWNGGNVFDNVTFDNVLLTSSNFNTYFNTNQYFSEQIFNSTSYSLDVTSDAGGTVSGNATDIAPGTTKTVTATPAQNYTFGYWTENNKIVSLDSSYTFKLINSRSLVAHFLGVTGTNVLNANVDLIKVFPNPTSDILNIDCNDFNSNKEIRILNNQGLVVCQISSKESTFIIDVKSLHLKGICMVQIVSNNKVTNHKVIVK